MNKKIESAAMILAQMTDLHAGEEFQVDGAPLDTLDAVRRAVVHLNALTPLPDAVAITGDLVAHEDEQSYAALAEVLAGLAIPFFLVPGNHDDRMLIRRAFADLAYLPQDGDFLHYSVEDLPLRLIALDSHQPGKIGGRLCAARLDWLAARLAETPERPSLILIHHPPIETGIPAFDAEPLEGAAAFGDLVANRPNVLAIACGHVHRNIEAPWCGSLVTVTASTGYQYPLEMNPGMGFTMVREPAVCRLFCWSPAAGLVSHVSYID